MNSARISAWRFVCLVLLLAGLPLFSPRHAWAGRSPAPAVCKKWPQNRLAIGISLKSRHFVLQPESELVQLPASLEAGAHRVFHRTFSLSLNSAEPIALFRTGTAKTCVIARDDAIGPQLKVPVFFIGSDGQQSGDLKEDAGKAAFAPTSSLTGADDFADVSFRLKRGGNSFSLIRPFFTCGLPGLILCERDCPSDLPQLAQTYVEWALKREAPQPETPGEPERGADCKPAQSPGPASPPKEVVRAPDRVSPPVAAAPKAARIEPKPGGCPPCAPAATPAPAPKTAVAQPAATATVPHVEEQPAPHTPAGPRVEEQAANPAATTPPPPAPAPSRQLVLAFEDKSRDAIDAGEVLQVEGSIAIMGAAASQVAGGLALDLPGDAFAEATKLETLQRALRHYHVAGVRTEEARTVVTAEPLFIRASGLTIKIAGGGVENVSGCELALDVFKIRRLGAGWSANLQSLRFREEGASYAPDLPGNAEKSALLIDTAEDGDAARLYSAGSGCQLEGRPNVTADEIRSGSIVRSLRELASGQTLIALVSTDSDFSDQAGAGVAEGFWPAALDLASSVSEGTWQRRVLGRVQAQGAGPETAMRENLWGGKLAAGQDRDTLLTKLIEGSRPGSDYLPSQGSRPIPRYELQQALQIVRRDAGLVPRDGAPQDALLLITGGIDPAGGYFCRHPTASDSSSPAPAQWASGVRKMFVLEVWSDTAAKALEGISRAKPAAGAPPGIYSCNFPGTDGGNIALYAVLPSSLSDSARAATFAWLTVQANSRLRP